MYSTGSVTATARFLPGCNDAIDQTVYPDVYVHYACFVNNTSGMRWTVSSTPVLFVDTGSVEDVLNIDDTYFILLTNTTGGFTATLSFVSAVDQDGMIITCQDLNDLATATTQLSIISKHSVCTHSCGVIRT